MDQYIGKMLDNRYEILERIGTGGMAVVYKAKCHRLNRLVAIKILKSDLAQNEEFRRRFNAESQAVAQLSHPNIVSVYDVSRGGVSLCISLRRSCAVSVTPTAGALFTGISSRRTSWSCGTGV